MANRLGTNPLDFIGQAPKQKPERVGVIKPKTPRPKPKRTSWAEKGCKEGYTRAMLFIRKDYLEKLKDMAYWDRKQIKEALEAALKGYFKDRVVKPRPIK
jgi:hypothetical protein